MSYVPTATEVLEMDRETQRREGDARRALNRDQRSRERATYDRRRFLPRLTETVVRGMHEALLHRADPTRYPATAAYAALGTTLDRRDDTAAPGADRCRAPSRFRLGWRSSCWRLAWRCRACHIGASTGVRTVFPQPQEQITSQALGPAVRGAPAIRSP
jgi:hypothetical protein